MKSKLRIFGVSIFLINLLAFSFNLNLVQAHIFSSDESASFLSIIDQLKSSLLPIKEDVFFNDTLAKVQSEYARTLLTDNLTKELKERNPRLATDLVQMLDSLQNVSRNSVNAKLDNINNILAEVISVRIESDKSNNATIHALALANDVNQILNEYVISVKGSNAQSNMNMNMSMSSMNIDQNRTMKIDIVDNANTSDKVNVINLPTYQRAKALTDIATERFNVELKGKSNDSIAMEQVGKGLDRLKMSIEKNSSTTTIMKITHGQIHPNLQTAFNLQLASTKQNNDNMSMSMHMPMSASYPSN